jgi:putative transposase
LGLHLVWCPKYRRRILGRRVVARCGEVLQQIAGEHGWQIVVAAVMPDRVDLFVRVGSIDAPAAVVRTFKGRTAWAPYQEIGYLPNLAKVLRSPSHFAASVGDVSESTVRRDIEHQWDAVAQ